MAVSVMNIGIMPVAVNDRAMPVPMAMGFADRITWTVLMLVVGFVDVPMLVFDGAVFVLVLMGFGQMQVKTDCHQKSRDSQAEGDWLCE